MPLVKVKPTSPGRRGLVKVVTPSLHKGEPYWPLVVAERKSNGRNNAGRITCPRIHDRISARKATLVSALATSVMPSSPRVGEGSRNGAPAASRNASQPAYPWTTGRNHETSQQASAHHARFCARFSFTGAQISASASALAPELRVDFLRRFRELATAFAAAR